MGKVADALIIIDMQKGVCQNTGEDINRLSEMTEAINQRATLYHQIGLPVIWIQHQDDQIQPDSEAYELLDSLNVEIGTDKIMSKTHPDAFYHTELSDILGRLSANAIEIMGAQVEYCVDSTIKAAFDRGYKILMQHGSSMTYDNAYMSASATRNFYENIWDQQFVEWID
ncbi:isochorismatase family protein [Weissella minor]|uniref:isochorismatase family protein n=1 Tax=Weissella minor TaxID=1620 RepID=UPI001BB03D0A|nr:isochorismatase family protein [Weissella minor]